MRRHGLRGLPLLEQIEGLPGGHVERGCSEGVERGHRVGTGQVPSHVQAVMLGRKVKRSVELLAEAGSVVEEELDAGLVVLFKHHLERRCVAVLQVHIGPMPHQQPGTLQRVILKGDDDRGGEGVVEGGRG